MARSSDEMFQQALAALQIGRMSDAERQFKKLLHAQPNHVAGLNLLGILLSQLGRYEEAARYVRRALKENTRSDTTFFNYGVILKALKRPDEALEQFSHALTINPGIAETWNNRGTVLNDLERYAEAIADFEKAISINPKLPAALVNKANALGKLKLYDESLDAYDRALILDPALAEAWIGRGNIFGLYCRRSEALAAFDRALALAPNLADAWLGRGNALARLERHNDALDAYDRSVALRPDLTDAWVGRGNVFAELNQWRNAFDAFDKALATDPYAHYAEGGRLFAKMHMCDWANMATEAASLIANVTHNKPACRPFALLAIPSSSADQLQCARRYVAGQALQTKPWQGEIYDHDRIRVGYLSADFHEHATALLTAGLFEQHDKCRFEITGISIGPHQDSEMRRRLQKSFERFIDVQFSSDQDIAQLIRRFEIDILVDLKGFTQNARFNILARRPAPIQVNYLGYPGTLGADCIDYIIADAIVIPDDHRKYYTEKVVWLPGSYQVNDSRRHIAERIPTRGECGLPDEAFIFCSFNNNYKIQPEVFRVWMRLLKAKKNSILWLLSTNAVACENLRREAEACGVAAERLIFAARMPIADHLARHRQADLFLDTLPYNAHTTASDALWSGLPVVTCLGSTFAGRVCGSLLTAVGLPELIAQTSEDYEALALKLAQYPELLASVKAKLAHNRLTHSLFDTGRFANRLETAYQLMWERSKRGEPPCAFAVPVD